MAFRCFFSLFIFLNNCYGSDSTISGHKGSCPELVKKIFHCIGCGTGVGFTNSINFSRHMNEEHNKQCVKVKCIIQECNNYYSEVGKLSRHLWRNHPQESNFLSHEEIALMAREQYNLNQKQAKERDDLTQKQAEQLQKQQVLQVLLAQELDLQPALKRAHIAENTALKQAHISEQQTHLAQRQVHLSQRQTQY